MHGFRTAVCVVVMAWAAAAHAQDPGSQLSPHARAALAHASDPERIDISGAKVPIQPLNLVPNVRPCATVFGYMPYWERTTNMRWDLLSHLAVFSIDINEFGNATGSTGMHGWPSQWAPEVNAAHAAGVKVTLVITLFDSDKLLTLLSTPAYSDALKANILAWLESGNADGVNLDFETNGTWRNYFVGFLSDLTNTLHTQRPGSEVTIAGPAVNWSGGWDLVGIANACDGIFIMGYAFAGSFSTVSGANAPYTGGTYNITNTVTTQYAGVPKSKMILGVPYYGNAWKTTSSAANSSIVSDLGSIEYTAAAAGAATYGRIWDANTQTPWYRYNDGTNWRQYWYDDADSLRLKYQLAIDQGLQGVGMWALGYDNGRQEYWNLLEELFGGCYPCCDYNHDRQVNLTDFNTLKFCLQGPAVKLPPGHTCLKADIDGDLDVDIADFQSFEQAFGH